MKKKYKKLYRSKTDRMFLGVCGGIAQYLGIKSKFVRIVYLVFILICSILPHFIALPVVLYFILFLAIPNNPYQKNNIFNFLFDKNIFNNVYKKNTPKIKQRKVIHNVKEKDVKK